jgi:hypothetical protein
MRIALVFPLLSFLAVSACKKDEVLPPDTEGPPQILFGDLHVHSTNSVDVFVLQLPLLGGKGEAGPAAHCDFARYCSQLDFWAITDHQEGAPTWAWDESREAVQMCNDLHDGDGTDPGMVTFPGFEWQQSSTDPTDDWGHKNVIFRDFGDSEIPNRAIASVGQVTGVSAGELELAVAMATGVDPDNAAIYQEVFEYAVEGMSTEACDTGIESPLLPTDCVEYAVDPATLYQKLDEWGSETLVIPHGYTWGAHHPPLTSWEHQLNPTQHDPKYQTLLEMYSGHGSMEEYRPWRAAIDNGDGTISCPESTANYLPCCWRAGEIVFASDETCQADPNSAECEQIVANAQQDFLEAGRYGFTDLKAEPADWLDCGECRDCFQPAEGHRPMATAQAGLARTYFDGPGEPLSYQFGFIGSTDSHAIGPGTGYKEFREMSDIYGADKPEYDLLVDLMFAQIFPDWVRQNSYYYSGGLVAAHAESRSRDAIWEALKNRNVYATTGDRILLWFDLTNAPDDTVAPMGSIVAMGETPSFEVRAIGAFKQNPGCPQGVKNLAPEGFVDDVCFGECYSPTDERHVMDRIEVVRITPQISPDEDIANLITDPLVVLECEPDPSGCVVTFTDPDYGTRPALYYVRAIQESTQQLNAENLRCDLDAHGNCLSTELCMGGYQGKGDDCLDSNQERAWASPIYLTPP